MFCSKLVFAIVRVTRSKIPNYYSIPKLITVTTVILLQLLCHKIIFKV